MKPLDCIRCLSLTCAVVLAASSTEAHFSDESSHASIVYSTTVLPDQQKLHAELRAIQNNFMDIPGRVRHFRSKAEVQPTKFAEHTNVASTSAQSPPKHNTWISFLHSTNSEEADSDADKFSFSAPPDDSKSGSGASEAAESHAESPPQREKDSHKKEERKEDQKAQNSSESSMTAHATEVKAEEVKGTHIATPMTEVESTEHTASDINFLIKRLHSLLQGSRSKELLSSLSNLVSIHGKLKFAT